MSGSHLKLGWTAKILKIPPLMMYTGHMIDQATRAVPRFPIALEGAVAAAIRQRLEAIRPLAAYGSAACGSDILCLEAMREVGGETHIVLPFPAADFRRISVDFRAGGWAERFERVLSDATSVTITSDHRARGSTATFEYANLVLTGKTRLRAQVLGTGLFGLAVWDGKPSTRAAGAASLVRLWRSQRIDFEDVPVSVRAAPPAIAAVHAGSDDDEQLPAGYSHEIRAMLFADAFDRLYLAGSFSFSWREVARSVARLFLGARCKPVAVDPVDERRHDGELLQSGHNRSVTAISQFAS